MRPTGSALVYVLATRGTSEEDFAQRQMQHLAGKGIRVRETSADDLDPESDGGDTDADTDTEDDESDGAESASADGAESATTDE